MQVGQALSKLCGLQRNISSCMATEGQPARPSQFCSCPAVGHTLACFLTSSLVFTLTRRGQHMYWSHLDRASVEHCMNDYCLHKR